MTKFIRSLSLVACVAFAATVTTSLAQEKKPAEKKPADTKKKADDTKKPAEGGMGKVEIYKSKSDGFRFRIIGADGKNICGAYKDYETKEECLKVVEELKEILTKTKPVDGK